MAERQRIDSLFQLIGKRIAYERKKKGLSQERLAITSDLSRSSIVLIEQGRQRVPIDRLYRIARSLNCSIDQLLPNVAIVFGEKHADAKPQIDKSSKVKLEAEGVLDEVNKVLIKY